MPDDRDACELRCLDLLKAATARERRPALATLEAWARDAKAPADPTRLALAVALTDTGSACICDVAWIVGRDAKLVSHHARALPTAGLAGATRQGKMVMYELTARGRALLGAVAAREEAEA